MILHPTDEAWAQKLFPIYAFGKAFQVLFPVGDEADAQFRIDTSSSFRLAPLRY